jgi:hypothetical protein
MALLKHFRLPPHFPWKESFTLCKKEEEKGNRKDKGKEKKILK